MAQLKTISEGIENYEKICKSKLVFDFKNLMKSSPKIMKLLNGVGTVLSFGILALQIWDYWKQVKTGNMLISQLLCIVGVDFLIGCIVQAITILIVGVLPWGLGLLAGAIISIILSRVLRDFFRVHSIFR